MLMKLTWIETAQPRLCRNRTVDEGGEHRSGGRGHGRQGWPVSPTPHVMLTGAQTHSDAAAERGVWRSDVTKQDGASLSPHKAAVSHCERKESGTSSGRSCKHSHSPQPPTCSHVPLKDPHHPVCLLCPNPPSSLGPPGSHL